MHRKSSTVLSGYLATLEMSFQSFLTFNPFLVGKVVPWILIPDVLKNVTFVHIWFEHFIENPSQLVGITLYSECVCVCPHLWHPSPSPFASTILCSTPYKPHILKYFIGSPLVMTKTKAKTKFYAFLGMNIFQGWMFFRGKYFSGWILFRGKYFSGVNIFPGWIFFGSEYFLGVNIFQGWIFSEVNIFQMWGFSQFTWSCYPGIFLSKVENIHLLLRRDVYVVPARNLMQLYYSSLAKEFKDDCCLSSLAPWSVVLPWLLSPLPLYIGLPTLTQREQDHIKSHFLWRVKTNPATLSRGAQPGLENSKQFLLFLFKTLLASIKLTQV